MDGFVSIGGGQIYSMVQFRNVAHGTDMNDWWDNGNNQIAFCRGDRGFIAINNEGYDLKETLQGKGRRGGREGREGKEGEEEEKGEKGERERKGRRERGDDERGREGRKGIGLQHDDKVNVTLYLNGTVDEQVTLTFNLTRPDVATLDPTSESSITVGPGAVDPEHRVTVIGIEGAGVGHTALVMNATPRVNMSTGSWEFVRVSVSHTRDLDYLSDAVGWLYFAAWSVSFYPQVYVNWRRRSVIGLHFDFLSLNTLGFLLYGVFNGCLFWSAEVKAQYFERHKYGVNPVQLNDVIFSIHAFFACIVQVVQCLAYERGDQQVSKTARGIFGTLALGSVVALVLGAAAVVQWLDFLYFISYVKLFITLIKYIPQAYYNYRRKSTSGWSIGNIVLDFTGGLLSITQMFIIAYNYNDWGSIFGDPTKFGLGLFSVVFDVFFMVQHYALYRGNNNDGGGYKRDLDSPTPPPLLTHSSSLTESASSVDYGATGTSY
ncbi:hypothetical protein Pcinc_027299 [Petrolisthes cinctipes]|uniref:Alpha-amylase C-terminal domain-containing protein n=1 Tax=Petrolisthes cinctipes TaxID=88211 RepID=A0AAE1F5C2_PETCI|nr:hypothetical protein Pcinc_027299 [Petrolisthes cinctipes]